ncbi:MAG: hypothetical protein AAF517_25765, partial [Planctomycetota bacterium]
MRKLLALAAFSLIGSLAVSAEVFWAKEGEGGWQDSANWQGKRLPGKGDRAYIENGGTAVVTTDLSSAPEELRIGWEGVGTLDHRAGV